MHTLKLLLLSAAIILLAAAAHAGETGPVPVICCDPWDNGAFDRQNAQTSQIGLGDHYQQVGRITADDFWLCGGNVYKINTIRGRLTTNSAIPKADIVLFEDCDGRPGAEIAHAYAVLPPDADLDAACNIGTITISETGETTTEGLRVIEIEATFDKLWLKPDRGGAAYWVSIHGYSGTGDSDDEFFWGTSGSGVVKGRPGHFLDDSLSRGGSWEPVDECCIGCTDFNFCVEGETCKVLLDNGGFDRTRYAASINNNGSLAQDARAADDIVIKDCADKRVCFVEGYLYSNCDPPRARLDVYDNACKLPATFSPPISFDPKCIIDTGETIFLDNRELKIYRVQFWDLRAGDDSPFTLQASKNYWFSIYALGTGSQVQRGYFAGAARCDRVCDGRTGHFNQAAVSGRGVGLPSATWRTVEHVYGDPFDLALMVAIEPDAPRTDPEPPGGTGPTCAADINRDGELSVQDLFDFIAVFFAGCP